MGDGYEEFAACEVAAALSVSSMAAKNLAYLGDVLAHRLPRVRAALERGDLDLMRVRVIIDRTRAITDPFLLAEAERRILAQVLIPGRCTTRGQTQAAADKVIATLDPAALIQRRRKAEKGRCVDIRADLDGMSNVYGSLPAADGAVLDRALHDMAMGVCGADPRTLAQRRADALTAWAAGHTTLPCTCESPDCPDTVVDSTATTEITDTGEAGGGTPIALTGPRAGSRAGQPRLHGAHRRSRHVPEPSAGEAEVRLVLNAPGGVGLEIAGDLQGSGGGTPSTSAPSTSRSATSSAVAPRPWASMPG